MRGFLIVSSGKGPAEQLARELLRESLFLPERWRLWFYERLREDLEGIDWEQHRIDQLGSKMTEAINALERVAEHLGLEDQRAQLRLTISEFDAAPESVRDGWRARRVAKTLRGSWSLAKGVVFGNERLPVAAELKWQRAKELARKRREGAFTLAWVHAWLETNPPKRTRNAYDAWVKEQNKQLPEGVRPIPLGTALWMRWRVPLTEIFQAAEEGRVPGEAEPDGEEGSKRPTPSLPGNSAGARSLNLEPAYRGQCLKAAREKRGLDTPELAQRTGLDPSTIRHIENAATRNSSFETLAKLAHALDLSLDELAAGPPDPPADPA